MVSNGNGNTDKQRNLKPWAKGQSGNPKGRPPKEKCLVTMIEQYLTYTPEQLKSEATKDNLDIAHRLAIKYLLDCNEHPNHTDKLMDRLYGAPRQSTEISNPEGESFRVEHDAKSKLISAINRLAARAGETKDTQQPDG